MSHPAHNIQGLKLFNSAQRNVKLDFVTQLSHRKKQILFFLRKKSLLKMFVTLLLTQFFQFLQNHKVYITRHFHFISFARHYMTALPTEQVLKNVAAIFTFFHHFTKYVFSRFTFFIFLGFCEFLQLFSQKPLKFSC